MKKSIYTILAITMFAITVFTGCNSDSDSGSTINDIIHQEQPPEKINPVPQINNAAIYKDDKKLLPLEAYSGEEVILSLSFTDQDKDLRRVYAEFYHEADDYASVKETKVLVVPPTTFGTFEYYFANDPYTIGTTQGFWKVTFYAVDEAGNESNEYSIDFLVR